MHLREKFINCLNMDGQEFAYYDLKKVASQAQLKQLPFSLKILLENLLRHYDGLNVTDANINALLNAIVQPTVEHEINFSPSRVLLQDFTGVPAIVDLAAMRDAVHRLGLPESHINPLSPVDLVIDHSVMVDHFGGPEAFRKNTQLEFQRNQERYLFLRWGQQAFKNFKVVPPGTGIVHQVNLEYLARVVIETPCQTTAWGNIPLLYPDTLVGTDSHTTMINGLGVLGWGVGGIEAEAAMLGQPTSMLIPQVVGVRLSGQLQAGTTATDLVLTVTELLRRHQVVGKFVEFFGPGLSQLPLADRATIANMAPEYGATCGLFPIDAETLEYLRLTGREERLIRQIEAYARCQTLFTTEASHESTPAYSQVVELNLSQVEPCIAGPKRPQDRIPLNQSQAKFHQYRSQLPNPMAEGQLIHDDRRKEDFKLKHGDVVIAALTSCTNTSNPEVMIAAGLIAQKAVQRGLKVKPWVKTSLAPGSQVVTEYLKQAGLLADLAALGFDLVGYGCTTCIGNSGPLPLAVEASIKQDRLAVSAVLSGNRNFEGRIHPLVQCAYLASPPLVVAYALAGTMDIHFENQPLGRDQQGLPVYLKDLWPSRAEVQRLVRSVLKGDLFVSTYAHVFQGDKTWSALKAPDSERFEWNEHSTYIKHPPYFQSFSVDGSETPTIHQARVLALLGDSITTDHISPAGEITPNSPAGLYLQSLGVGPAEFNAYGARRGNHEVMIRGTFANVRLRNLLLEREKIEGGMTLYFPPADPHGSDQKPVMLSIYEASQRYLKDKQDLIIIAGKEYGTGSSRDWAAKGTRLLGVKAVIAESFERIHRSNLIGMGVLPLQFEPQQSAKSLQLTGFEQLTIDVTQLKPRSLLEVLVTRPQAQGRGQEKFSVIARIETPKELEYYWHGGILPYVLRQLIQPPQIR